MICAYICFKLRYTLSLGRSGVPKTFFRTLRWRLRRAALRSTLGIVLTPLLGHLARLAGLADDLFTLVHDALAEVGLGLAHGADRSEERRVGKRCRVRGS